MANTKTIAYGLNNLFKEINKAEKANLSIDASFKGISAGIENTTAAFEDILVGVKSLSSGTQDITSAVNDVVSASREMTGSIRKINEMIVNNTTSINSISEKSLRTLSGLENITLNYNDIASRSKSVNDLGMQSDAVFKALDESIRAI